MRHQDEDGAGRRLLEALEERVGGVLVHVFGRMNERDAQPAAVRADVQEVRELAHLLDLDLDARLLGLRPALVGFVGRRLARASGSTRRKSGWLPPRNQRQPSQAPQGFLPVPSHRRSCASSLGERELADAARPVDQERVRQALEARARANRGSAGSRGASEVRECALERLADLGHRRGGVDHAHALPARPWRARGRRRARARKTPGPRARSGRASFRRGSRLLRDFVASSRRPACGRGRGRDAPRRRGARSARAARPSPLPGTRRSRR